MRESEIEEYLHHCVQRAGGTTRKVKWIGRRGAPDRRVMIPGLCVWVELKAPGEKLKPHQEREHARMVRYGERVVTIDSFAGVDGLLLELLK